jgi:hypothetical protein
MAGMEKKERFFLNKLKMVKNLPLLAKALGMISFEEALEITVNQAVVLGVEEVSFEQAPGRILASDIL